MMHCTYNLISTYGESVFTFIAFNNDAYFVIGFISNVFGCFNITKSCAANWAMHFLCVI
jgi:hypothetical protein